jgi:hypothetical protein
MPAMAGIAIAVAIEHGAPQERTDHPIAVEASDGRAKPVQTKPVSPRRGTNT